MKLSFIFCLLFVSTSAFSSTDVINSKFHNPNNKKISQKIEILTVIDNRVINSKFHHPGNKAHHVIKKNKNK
ncbi:hypothetical protein VXS04_04055 [Photobacterium piscicola]|uniref:hypothetical protein n=1 Tax=Photobacterium piscicola TaxID=1378299 RepID=UPI002E18E160|nr:hypothetical protein [Photobacterium piscicola]